MWMENIKTKDSTKHKILDAAMQVFVKSGYSKTTMDDIVNYSGLSKGAIYHYYGSKKELFLSLIDHWEIYSFPNFYSKGNKEKSASEILMNLSDIVLNVFKKMRHVFFFHISWNNY